MKKAFVEMIVGTLGGYKSYTAVRDYIIPWLVDGADVFTNIQVEFEPMREYIGKKYGVKIQKEQLVYITKKGLPQGDYICKCTLAEIEDGMMGVFKVLRQGRDDHPNLLVWDEGHLDADARDYRSQSDHKKQLYEFITQARKLDIHTLFITQNENNIDTRIRRMVTFYIGCKDGDEVRFLGLPLFKGGYFNVRWDPNAKSQKKSKFKTRDLGIFKCYRSKALFSEYNYEQTTDRQLEKWKPKRTRKQMVRFYIILACVVAAGLTIPVLVYKKVMGRFDQHETIAAMPSMPVMTNDADDSTATMAKILPVVRHYVSLSICSIEGKRRVRVVTDDGRTLTGSNLELLVMDDGRVWVDGVPYYPPVEIQVGEDDKDERKLADRMTSASPGLGFLSGK